MLNCFIHRCSASGQCACGAELEGDFHVLSVDGVPVNACCREHCPVCSPKVEAFVGTAETISGEQEVLWSN